MDLESPGGEKDTPVTESATQPNSQPPTEAAEQPPEQPPVNTDTAGETWTLPEQPEAEQPATESKSLPIEEAGEAHPAKPQRASQRLSQRSSQVPKSSPRQRSDSPRPGSPRPGSPRPASPRPGASMPGDPGVSTSESGDTGTGGAPVKNTSQNSKSSKAKAKSKAKAAREKEKTNSIGTGDSQDIPQTMQELGSLPSQTSAKKGPFAKMDDNLDAQETIQVQDGKDGINPCLFFFMAAGVAVPTVILVETFSTMGKGLEVFDFLALRVYDRMGTVIIAACAFLGCFLYVLDWALWGCFMKVLTTVSIWGFLCFSCVLKCRLYPAAPAVMLMFNVAVICGTLRRTFAMSMRRSAFYLMFTVMASLAAVVILLRWVLWVMDDNDWTEANKQKWARDTSELYDVMYTERALNPLLDCGSNRTEYLNALSLTTDEKSDIGVACKKANTVLFTVWANPLIAAVCCFFMATFTLLNGVLLQLHGQDDVHKLEKLLKRFLGMLVFTLMGMYLSINVSGASLQLGSTLMAFFAAGLAATFVWTWMELGQTNLETRMKHSKLVEMIHKAYTSDWGRAMLIGGFNVLLPCYLGLNMLKHKMRKATGNFPPGLSDEAKVNDIYTPWGRKLVDEVKSWRWASILVKICLLGELFFVFQVGVAKATYIFLSWLNAQLSSVSYGVVIAIVFFIGYTMFLLPPVPGVPVYVFCGIVVAEQGRKIDSIGTVGGCTIACVLALILKLAACTGQWGIGFALGKSVKIQQLIGVDKVPTRAIEKILSRAGLDVGKVAVLVGGPDWPTSVTCGILKLSIPQMLLGTAPVFFVASPCVLAGAFMARVVPGEDSIYVALSGVFLLLSGIGQMGAGLMAVSCITKCIEQHVDELAKPRPEHEAVAKLTAAEADMVKAYAEVTSWSRMGCMLKSTISVAAVLQLLSGFIFAMGGEYCFETFAVSSDIDAPYEDNGLDGKPWTIVKGPGWGAMGLFGIGTFLHIIFSKVTGRMAKTRLEQGLKSGSLEEGSPSTAVIGASLVENRE